jgi:hypothetical protein
VKMTNQFVDQSLARLQDERDGVALYQTLSEVEQNPKLAEVYRRLAGVEQQHAERWVGQLQAAGVAIPTYRSSWRTSVLTWLARRFGVAAVLPSVASLEQVDAHKYGQEGVPGFSHEERSHSRLLLHITQPLQGGLEGGAVAQIEGRHRAGGGNALRAAVLGANDGLVSNLSLVMGVAGAALSGSAILVTGLAGLLAGAFFDGARRVAFRPKLARAL